MHVLLLSGSVGFSVANNVCAALLEFGFVAGSLPPRWSRGGASKFVISIILD